MTGTSGHSQRAVLKADPLPHDPDTNPSLSVETKPESPTEGWASPIVAES